MLGVKAIKLMKWIFLKLISMYQKYISPKKGFSCAHRIYFSGSSCSQHCAEVIREFGVVSGLIKMNARFQECKTASVLLSQGTDKDKDKNDPGKWCSYGECAAWGCCFYAD